MPARPLTPSPPHGGSDGLRTPSDVAYTTSDILPTLMPRARALYDRPITIEQAYAILGLRRRNWAAPTHVKNAYRRLVAMYHPDKWTKAGSAAVTIAGRIFRELHAAYEIVIKDAEKRRPPTTSHTPSLTAMSTTATSSREATSSPGASSSGHDVVDDFLRTVAELRRRADEMRARQGTPPMPPEEAHHALARSRDSRVRQARDFLRDL